MRRNFRKLIFFAVSLGFGLLLYAFTVEPYWIEVTHHGVSAPIQAPLRIAHLTDLHTPEFGRLEKGILRTL